MFYGAIESTKIRQSRATAIFETSRIIKDPESINIDGELVTLSRWEVTEDILVAEIVFADALIKKNPDVRMAYYHHLLQLYEHPLRNLGLSQLHLFSNEFAKVVKFDWDYKMSAAYTDLILHEKKITLNGFPLEGITLP